MIKIINNIKIGDFMNFSDVFEDFNTIKMEFIKGLVIFTVFLIVAIEIIPDFAYIPAFLAAIGLLYVGYKSLNYIQGAVLAIIASIPGFFVMALTTNPDFQITGILMEIEVLIGVLIIGLICGVLGFMFKVRSEKAYAEEAKKQNLDKKPSKKDR